MRHQCFIGRDDVLAVIEGDVDHLTGNTVGAADQLDDDVDLGIGRHRGGVLVPAHRRQVGPAVAPPVASRHRGDEHATTGSLTQQIGLPVQQLQDAGPNSAETGDGDLERRFHDGTPDAVCEATAASGSSVRSSPL